MMTGKAFHISPARVGRGQEGKENLVLLRLKKDSSD